MESTNKEEPIVLTTFLKNHIAKARDVLEKGDVKRGRLRLLTSSIRRAVAKVYGAEHEITRSLSPKLISENLDVKKEFERRWCLLEGLNVY